LHTNNTAPTITGTYNIAAGIQVVEVSLDGISFFPATLLSGIWSYSGFTGVAEGVYDVRARSIDASLNVSTMDVTTNELSIDVTPPTVTATALGTALATPTITGSISNDIFINSVKLQVEVNSILYTAINNQNGTWSASVANQLANGTYNVRVLATDSALNVRDQTFNGVLTVNVTPIFITINQRLTNDNTPQITGTISEPNTTSFTLSVNNTVVNVFNRGDGTWTADITTPLPDGIYNLVADATNNANVRAFDNSTNELTIDTKAPNIVLNRLYTNQRRPLITGTISETTATTEVFIDGSTDAITPVINPVAQADGLFPWSVPVELLTQDYPDGTLEVIIRATDTFGNIREVNSADSIRIDATAPIVTANNILTGNTSPLVTGTITDETATLSLIINNVGYTPVINGTTWSIPESTIQPALADGVYGISYLATDSLQNVAEGTLAGAITIDAIPVSTVATGVTHLQFNANWEASLVTKKFALDVARDPNFTQPLDGFTNLEVEGNTSVVLSNDFYHKETFFYRVRMVYADNSQSENSNVTTVRLLESAGLIADSTALVQLYKDGKGDTWTKKENWLTIPSELRNWEGVTVAGSRAVALALPNNNITGSLSNAAFQGLDGLVTLNLSGNNITRIPSLNSLLSLRTIDVSNNLLDFASLEIQAGINPTLNASGRTFLYMAQGEALAELQLVLEEGIEGVINRVVGGTNNEYTWTKNQTQVPIQKEGRLQFAITRFEDEGVYYATVTNANVPNLTLTTKKITVLVSSLERDRASLLTIYAENGGANWVNPAGGAIVGWNATTPISQWSFVSTTSGGLRVSGVNLSNVGLTGDLNDKVLAMSALTTLNLSGNSLTRLPNFTTMVNLVSLNISDNKLQFDDLQRNLGIATYSFSPQKPLLARNLTKVPAGTDVPISVPVRGADLTYSWLFKGVKISEASGSTYTIPAIGFDNMGEYTLEVTDLLIGGGFKLTIDPQEYLATANISGKLLDTNGQSVDQGTVILYNIRPAGQAWQVISNLVTINGNYTFNDIVLDNYVVQSIGDIEEYLPSYHINSFTWSLAEVIELRKNEFDKDITYVNQVEDPVFDPEDDNSVFGIVGLDDDNFPPGFFDGRTLGRRSSGNSGVSFSRLRATNRGEEEFDLVAYVLTDEEGKFSVTNLKDGTYKINIEYPGVPMDPNSFIIFDLGLNGTIDQNILNLDAEVFPDRIEVRKVAETGIYRDYFKNLNIFPNPATDYINISYERLNSDNVKMEIIDLAGSKILEAKLPSGFNQNVQLDVTQLKAGLYIINFIDTKKGVRSVTSSKIIISR
jgi:hypothetical protein